MGFYKFVLNYLKNMSIPVARSIFKAYKHTTSNAKDSQSQSQGSGSNNNNKQHPMDQFFKKMLSKSNLTAPPLDQSTALKILNIEIEQDKQLEGRHVLDRYWTLYQKNDPEVGGTVYLQCKVLAAKDLLMSEFPNATQIQQQFYKQVVQPQLKAKNGQQVQEQSKQPQKQQKDNKQNNQQKK